MSGTSEGIVLRETVRWYEPKVGYATTAEPTNAFGLRDDRSLVTVEASADGTVLTWRQYYDADDLAAMRVEFDNGLTDIAECLTRRFGGEILERFADVAR